MQVDLNTGVAASAKNMVEIDVEKLFDPESFYTFVIKNNEQNMTSCKDDITIEVNGSKEVRKSDFSTKQLSNMLVIKAKLMLAVK